jgi:hypothetical protein
MGRGRPVTVWGVAMHSSRVMLWSCSTVSSLSIVENHRHFEDDRDFPVLVAVIAIEIMGIWGVCFGVREVLLFQVINAMLAAMRAV